ncbi:hypothetical protein PoB_006590000 [Plakobranchus ocellatus]|uniref:Uncharacterized protein n=1 Tax=Plakobranchus ocellatus TaxID=259542 RepID=A0AAV4D5L4_9GAST|nr:hypothetical protein PoB_006590000 [Plakobranchus ocellatus]
MKNQNHNYFLSRDPQKIAAHLGLKKILRDNNISKNYIVTPLHAFVFSIILHVYAYEIWTITADLQRLQTLAMTCYGNILRVTDLDHIINNQVDRAIEQHTGNH